MWNYQSLLPEPEQRIDLDGNGYIKLLSCHTTRLGANYEIGFHEHPHWELTFMLSGEMVSWCDERKIECRMDRNEMFFVPPGIIHRRKFGPDGFNCNLNFVLLFSDKNLAGLMESVCLRNHFHFEAEGFALQLMEEIRKEYRNGSVVSNSLLPLLAKSFLLEFLKKYIRGIAVNRQSLLHWRHYSPQEKSTMIYSVLQANIGKPDVEKIISRNFNLSLYHLNRIFKAGRGTTIAKAVLESRLELARAMLKNTDISIQEISSHLGFCSRSGFYLFFRKYHGMTPQEYRVRNIRSDVLPFETGSATFAETNPLPKASEGTSPVLFRNTSESKNSAE